MKRIAGPLALGEILRKASLELNAVGNGALQASESTLLRSTAAQQREDAEEAFKLENALFRLSLQQRGRPEALSDDEPAEPETPKAAETHIYTVRLGTSPLDTRTEQVEAVFFAIDSTSLVFYKHDDAMPNKLRPFLLLPVAQLISIREDS